MRKPREFWINQYKKIGPPVAYLTKNDALELAGHDVETYRVREVSEAREKAIAGLVEALEHYLEIDLFKESHMKHYKSFAREALEIWEEANK